MSCFSRSPLRIAFGLMWLMVVFAWASSPVTSMGTITLAGKATCPIGLYGSPNYSLTTAPGQTGASISLDPDSPGDPAPGFNGSVNFGLLQNGDGTPSVASFALRERGNSQCHVSVSVSAYSASNLSYSGTPLAGGIGSELTFVSIGSGAVTAGANGNSSGHNYGPRFTSGSDTLATLNSGTIGAVTSSSDQFASLSQAPSTGGNLTSSDNWVQDTVTFSVPTGFVWAPTDGSGTGTFTIAVQFEIFSGV